ncbi:MAG: serine/threonine protein kinase [Polyangiaceae bacterium]|nr:serine/threonine protein kinase [Polyangiaceae bacterium]
MTIENKFVLLRLIGKGSMGAVYEARDEWIQRHVALKLLHPRHAQSSHVVRRFRKEAQAMARVSHPNVVAVHEMGRHSDGTFFIVQELLTGRTLREHLDERQRLSIDEAVEILSPIMGALIAAHGQGIVHRDVKPDNIILNRSPSGELIPKLVDFGIAKVPMPPLGGRQHTVLGELLGTPRYMSPEQAGGMHPLDGRADVWAVGVVLYEMLSGVCPFDGPTAQRVLALILSEPLPPIQHRVGVPDALAGVLARALDRDIEKRFPTMQAFREALVESTTKRPPAAGAASIPAAPELLDPAELEYGDAEPASTSQPPPPPQRAGHSVRPAPREDMAWARDETLSTAAHLDPDADAAERSLAANRLDAALTLAESALQRDTGDDARAGRMRLVQAIAHRWLGHYDLAERCAQDALRLLPRGSGGWYAALGYAAIASGYLGRSKQLLRLYEEIKKIDATDETTSFHVVVMSRLTIFLLRAGFANVAHKIHKDAQDLARGDGGGDLVVSAWLDAARAEIASHRGDLVTYLLRVESAALGFTAAGDLRNACLQRANVGNAYMHLGACKRAVAIFHEALAIAEPMALDLVAPVKVNLGHALAELGRLDEAIAVETAALAHCIAQDHRRFAAVARIYLSRMYSTKGDVVRAGQLARECVGALDEDTGLRAYALAALARVMLAEGSPAAALALAQGAMDLMRKLGGVEEGESLIRTTFALALRATGKDAQGHEEIERARSRLLERAGRIQDPHWRKSFLEAVADNARVMDLASRWADGASA